MRLCCAYEQTDGQGNEVTYSGTQNPLRVKTRAQTFGFVLSRVCQCHEIFVVLLGCCWFSIDRDRQGGTDEYICGQKIHILQTELKSKRWRQFGRNEKPRNFEFVNWCVFGKKTFIILHHDCWSLGSSRCLSVNSVTYLLYYLLTGYCICALKYNLFNWNQREVSRFICVIRMSYTLPKMN